MLIRALAVVALLISPSAFAQLRWQEGRHYTTMTGARPAGVPAGKIEVAEVFSYGCIYCYRFKAQITELAKSLPADAQFNYVHASFLPSEAWPMFQRAFYAARSLGIADATHEAMFAAVWETGEIPLLDLKTGRILNPLPTIEAAAKFYARLGPVKQAAFLATANSPQIDAEMKRADDLVKQWKIPGTPSVVVNGRYMVTLESVSNNQDLQQLVAYLVGLERTRLKLPKPAAR
jgi:protein dithiol oxidoreductase (disulfide-forming)